MAKDHPANYNLRHYFPENGSAGRIFADIRCGSDYTVSDSHGTLPALLCRHGVCQDKAPTPELQSIKSAVRSVV